MATIISSAILQMPAPRATPTPITNTNTNVAAGRRIKTLYRSPSPAPPSTVTIVSVSNNLSPRMRVLLFILRYPCVFCGIDTNLGAGAYRTIALKRIDRTVERYWHWTLELNYEEFETASAEWNQETADRVDAQGPAGIRALTALRQYAHTPLQPYVVANQSRGPACDAQSDAGCRGIHDEIAEPCMTPRNPPLGKFDRTTEYH